MKINHLSEHTDLFVEKLLLQIFVAKISDYSKIWEHNLPYMGQGMRLLPEELDKFNSLRVQVLIKNLKKLYKFCTNKSVHIDQIYICRISSFISVFAETINQHILNRDAISGGYEDWMNMFMIHSLKCNLKLPYNIKYGIIVVKLDCYDL